MDGFLLRKVAVTGMLPDLSNWIVVIEGSVKSTQVQNNGLDARVILQYWQTWVRTRVALIFSTGSVTRKPVGSLSAPDWQR